MSSAGKLMVVRREHILGVWHEIEPVLARVVVENDVGEDCLDVLAGILAESYQCFVWVDGGGIKCVVITTITNNRKGKVARIVYVAGSGLTEWLDYVEVIIDWCKAQGCMAVEGIGRRGWEKVLAAKGFRLKSTLIVRDIQ
jgi:hypothetical protein